MYSSRNSAIRSSILSACDLHDERATPAATWPATVPSPKRPPGRPLSGVAIGGLDERETFEAQPARHQSFLAAADEGLGPGHDAAVADFDVLPSADDVQLEAQVRVVAACGGALRPGSDLGGVARPGRHEGLEHLTVTPTEVRELDRDARPAETLGDPDQGVQVLSHRPELERLAACVPTGGYETQQGEMGERAWTVEPLGSNDSVDRRQVNHRARSPIAGEQASPANGGLEGQRGGRVGGDLAAPHGGDDTVLMNAGDDRVGPQRGER